MTDEWPFDETKNVAVFTIWRILNNESPILVVYHDASVRELAALPLGWRAWRQFPGGPWTREKRPAD